ncbi:MAG: manganese catalase family protein [Oscillospiraceae bacterium]|nr:manganese catalase family protein [Oscillospiraceae bacterium]
MFEYKKYLEYPVKVKNANPKLANIIITQYGGPYRNCLSSIILISRTQL